MKELISTQLADNVNLHVIPCDIFKTASINIFIPCELNENYTYHALIPQVLRRGSVSHPDQRSIEILMQELYGANFGASVKKYGDKQILSFYMDIVDGQYTPSNENLFFYAIDFLKELIFEPVTENGLFRHEYVLQEAFNLKQQILSIINDKYEYGKKRLLEEMDKGKAYVKCAYGDAEELENIDESKLFSIYKDIINNNPVDIFVAGNVNEQDIRSEIIKKFGYSNRNALPAYRFDKSIPQETRYCQEVMDVKQGKLNIGYRTNISADSPDYFKLLMFNAIFGGTVNSKLFVNVREKAGLCYSVNSYIDKFNGLLVVCTGIEVSNYQKAYDIIKEQLQTIINGEISDFEYNAAIKDACTRAKAVNDSAFSMINFYYSNSKAGINVTPNQYIDNICSVKKEDISAVASKIYEDTVYFLKNKGETDG